MLPLDKIVELVDCGDFAKAYKALNQILDLGPKSLRALKLKALMYACEGRFSKEDALWQHIFTEHEDDIDAIEWHTQRHIEEKELFYFTDILAHGRRFLAVPKAMIETSVLGLVGCFFCLLLGQYSTNYFILTAPLVSIIAFLILVLCPWFRIITSYFRSLQSVVVSPQGIEIITRARKRNFLWDQFQTVCLARSEKPGVPSLALILIPSSRDLRPLEIDLDQDSSPLRARKYFVADLEQWAKNMTYDHRGSLELGENELVRF